MFEIGTEVYCAGDITDPYRIDRDGNVQEPRIVKVVARYRDQYMVLDKSRRHYRYFVMKSSLLITVDDLRIPALLEIRERMVAHIKNDKKIMDELDSAEEKIFGGK